MEQVIELVRASGALMREYAAKAQVSRKGRSNYVTDADVAVQEFLRTSLIEQFPDYGFFSEEQENHPDFTRPLWILDPIDGTANFITRYRTSAVSLALHKPEGVVFGAVYNPFTDELYTATRGKGAYLNGQPIHAEQKLPLCDLLVDMGTMPYYKDRAVEMGKMATALVLNASDLRRCGSAALALCHMAEGRIGAMMEGILSPWDYAAGSLIAAEAGACVTDWKGQPLSCKQNSSVLAIGKQAQTEMLALIKEVLEA